MEARNRLVEKTIRVSYYENAIVTTRVKYKSANTATCEV